jgi:hypothetical protein
MSSNETLKRLTILTEGLTKIYVGDKEVWATTDTYSFEPLTSDKELVEKKDDITNLYRLNDFEAFEKFTNNARLVQPPGLSPYITDNIHATTDRKMGREEYYYSQIYKKVRIPKSSQDTSAIAENENKQNQGNENIQNPENKHEENQGNENNQNPEGGRPIKKSLRHRKKSRKHKKQLRKSGKKFRNL